MGGTLYLRNLARCLSLLPDDTRPRIKLLGAPNAVRNFSEQCEFLDAFDIRPGKKRWQKLLAKLGWNGFGVEQGIDAIYPGFGASVPGAVTIRWIPDFQHRYLPQLFSDEEIAKRDQSIENIANSPGVVVLSSEAAAADFARFFPDHAARPRVWHFYSILDLPEESGCQQARQEFNLPEKYLYLPNQFWVHKNHITVFRALAQLRRSQNLEIPLVCTGAQADRRDNSHFDSLLAFLKEQKLEQQVFFLGLLPRAKQLSVLRGAAAVLQPSLFEGWSTVVEDARATGRPAILSDIAVHREQAPKGARYFSAESTQSLAELLADTWPRLNAGPDSLAEKRAAVETQKKIIDSAHKFYSIAFDALSVRGYQ